MPADGFFGLDSINYFNMRDETGAFTDVEISVTTKVGSLDRDILPGDPIAAGTVPAHAPPLSTLAGFLYAKDVSNPSITGTWSDLDPNQVYEVYVFGFDGDGFTNVQNVNIAGDTSQMFSQSPGNNELWVKGEKGDSSRDLSTFAVEVAPNPSGEIVVTTTATSGSAVLGDLAIRPTRIIVNSPLGNTTPGDGLTTLREAILDANASSGADTILFDPTTFATPQTITLGGTELEITDTLTIDASAVTIDANQGSRVLNFSGSIGDMSLTGLTITGGRTATSMVMTF